MEEWINAFRFMPGGWNLNANLKLEGLIEGVFFARTDFNALVALFSGVALQKSISACAHHTTQKKQKPLMAQRLLFSKKNE